ncbi:type II toxin-antitoxin system VapC family toxin [Nocardia stercoris]|uniref:Ribonuclease VapC n=1 Tax=Nocardia stercoris TaxID=2483361 RepID=A0A3M2KWH1_9NOCA|nr:type II toxin-antitoxin system VapC family toxin [Nocardia stercoris]RMI29937.1 type II toxin-antitoxin system VapC family toxin [Nocardia stercoris]
MIILDTNVLSELVKREPAESVVRWLDSMPAREICTTSITAAELWFGVRRLPSGRRKVLLAAGIDDMLYRDLQGRIEPFDTVAAGHYADIVCDAMRSGRTVSAADAEIAAICIARRAELATRNVKDFADTGVEIINPWDFQAD